MNNPGVKVDVTGRFLKDIKHLQKKYPKIRQDLKPLTNALEEGLTPGEQIPGVKYTVYKERLKSSDMKKGQRGGYRVVYYIRTANHVFYMVIYPKAERENISAAELNALIDELERQLGRLLE
jgi:mRNA-degrading endonuclease RelE of RelBE toxin-antitoxin system